MERILVVDDEKSIREFLALMLRESGYRTDACGTVAGAREALAQTAYDLVVTDLKLPDGTGIEVLSAAKKADSDTEVVVITAFATAETAVEAMKQGAYDYLTKPFKVDHMRLTVAKALEKAALSRENRELRRRIREAGGGDFLSRSPKLQEIMHLVERVAPTGVTVLVWGESGTGKEIVARRLHEMSGRKGRFVAINCSAIPEGLLESELFGHVRGSFTGAVGDKAGLFEEASGGTLFLDEVAELPLVLQPKLLRALQEGRVKRVGGNREVEVDVRIVSATNRDLAAEVHMGRFREDLYYRLNVVAVRIPPLRERKEDIPLLAQHFVERYRKAFGREVKGVLPEALTLLECYDFPGNVRELENIVERAVALEAEPFLTVRSLPDHVRGGPAIQPIDRDSLPENGMDLDGVLASTELHYVRQALERSGGNKTEAAKLLGLTFRSLRYRLEKLGIP